MFEYSKSSWGGSRLELKQGDITLVHVDVIVNAANEFLRHGGGVAGAIVRKGGHIIQEESNKIGRIPVGEVAVTSAGNLPSRYVIHAVGPKWHGGKKNEQVLLHNAVWNALEKAKELGVETIALPSISTGIFGYPLEQGATVILKAINEWLEKHPGALKKVIMVLYDKRTFQVYARVVKEIVES